MTAKEYLSQAYHLDQRINSLIAQEDSLNGLATKCTSVMTGMPHSPNHGTSSMENAIVKIVDLQHEINDEIDRLVDLKVEIATVIHSMDNPEYSLLLEQRYLCFRTWPEIASQLGYSLRHTQRLHEEALANVQFEKRHGLSLFIPD